MKKILFFIICLFPVLFSCSKWLDVKPKSEIKSDVMFETEQGFKDAMIGCYIGMSNRTIYGQELTMTFLDAMAQQYDFTTSGIGYVYSAASRYDYGMSNVEMISNKIWLDMYNVIANVNNIIKNLEGKEKIISPIIFNVVKGEAYALRAFLHLDLLRMFSYGDLGNRPEKLKEVSIPYQTEYNKIVSKRQPLGEVLRRIHEDLDIAIPLLEQYDPISKIVTRPSDYYIDSEDLFLKNRTYHMNHLGALATKMRVMMWESAEKNSDKILEIADYLMKTANIQWISDANINSVNIADRDLTFSTEQLFGIETFERFKYSVERFFKITLTTASTVNPNAVYIGESKANKLYEISSGIGASDCRYMRLFNSGSKFEIIRHWAFTDSQGFNGLYVNAQPLIRTPEIYYMAIECNNLKGNTQDAVKMLNTVRNSRFIPASKNLDVNLSQEEIAKELEKEYRKEFIAEGQLFYFYKRLGYKEIENSTKTPDDDTYIIPIPVTDR